jgi:hypothetical protein
VEWFLARDVCECLEIVNIADALSTIPENEKSNIGIADLRKVGIEAGNRGLIAVNEPGLYRLIFKSRKEAAESFKTWVFTEVLPLSAKPGNTGPGASGKPRHGPPDAFWKVCSGGHWYARRASGRSNPPRTFISTRLIPEDPFSETPSF